MEEANLRERYGGTSKDIAAKVAKIAAKKKSWCKYPTYGTKIADAKCHKKKLFKAKKVIKALQELHPKLSFTKSQMKGCVKILFRANHKKWKLKPAMEKSYCDEMDLRLRTICAVVKNVCKRKKPRHISQHCLLKMVVMVMEKMQKVTTKPPKQTVTKPPKQTKKAQKVKTEKVTQKMQLTTLTLH